MTRKILIAYATRCGSTAEVADAIGDVLREAGAEVDVRSVEAVGDVSAYQAAVLGTAVRVGACLPSVAHFVQTHRDALIKMPVALFCVCLADVLDGKLSIPRTGWLLLFGVVLFFGAALVVWFARKRFRQQFVGLEQTVEELREDAEWFQEWVGRAEERTTTEP